jgi:hypothetical protein
MDKGLSVLPDGACRADRRAPTWAASYHVLMRDSDAVRSSKIRQGGAALRLDGSIPSPLRGEKALHSGPLVPRQARDGVSP